ncbi:MAG: sigma-70 family RNA polymerase sigma factor [Planctomycetota bacterium]|nr:MAG: sigma-70 family RNA polymerase sigma factor [Planctomycetota bacterium]
MSRRGRAQPGRGAVVGSAAPPKRSGGGVREAEGRRRPLSPQTLATTLERAVGARATRRRARAGGRRETHLGPSDESLEVAWRKGSREAFAELFRRHYPGAVSYARAFLRDGAAAEDIAQQAFLNVFQRKRGRGRFLSLVYTVTRNLALNELRRQGRRYVARSGLGEADPPLLGRPGPVGELIRTEEERGLEEALAALPADLREALCLKETRGMTYAEVGQVMSLHPDAVRRRVAKALDLLRRSLKSRSLL